MNIPELFRSAFRSLRAHKLRSFLTLLGMTISVAAIVAVVSIISGLNKYVADQVMILSPDMFVVERFGFITSRKEWLDALKRPNITMEDYRRLRAANLPSVAEIGAGDGVNRIVSNGTKKLERASIVGVTEKAFYILNVEIEAGRMFAEAEDDAGRQVALIGADIREELFGQQDPIGRTILVAGMPYQVIGLMPKRGSGGFTDTDTDIRVYIPLSLFKRNFNNRWFSLQIYVKAKSVDLVEEAKDEVRAFMRAMRHTDYRAPDPFGIFGQETIMDFWKKISAAMFLFITLISGVSLCVGGIVVMNIMLVSVAERTQEIGIRMALGARKRDILRQFLLEAALMSLVGGILGFMVGAGLALGVRAATGFPAQVTFSIVAMAIGLAALVGVLAGFFPARRAANLVVIDAIRAE